MKVCVAAHLFWSRLEEFYDVYRLVIVETPFAFQCGGAGSYILKRTLETKLAFSMLIWNTFVMRIIYVVVSLSQ